MTSAPLLFFPITNMKTKLLICRIPVAETPVVMRQREAIIILAPVTFF